MEDRITRLEQDNMVLKRDIKLLQRKLKEVELQIRKLDRICQSKRPRG